MSPIADFDSLPQLTNNGYQCNFYKLATWSTREEVWIEAISGYFLEQIDIHMSNLSETIFKKGGVFDLKK